jgi:hypothetical protein
MKHSTTDSAYHTNLLQALQKNKAMQCKLTQSQDLYYVKLLKDLQTYNLKEKYNRELLYTWKKESYIRQLQKELQRCRIKDAYYEYQVRKLGDMIAGQQTLVIPHSEEERRLDVTVKYHQFLDKNPLQGSVKSVHIPTEEEIKAENDKKEQEEIARNLEDTWKYIHAKSAVGSRRKSNNRLPNIHRPSTMNVARRKNYSAKTITEPISTSPEIVQSSFDDRQSPNDFQLLETIEPLNITSDIINKHTRADLESMRSVRRPRKNAFELNLLFETRKQIYEINKRSLDIQLYQRKCRLKQNIQLKRFKPREFIEESTENIPKQEEEVNQQPETIVT